MMLHNTLTLYRIFAILLTVLVGGAAVGDDLPDEPPVTVADRDHWSFRPLERPSVPTVRDESWTRNPIDHFVLAQLETQDLAPLPPASRETLIRRLSYDLLGLPPSPAQVNAFLADAEVGAYERLVDRLLASPHFGPRWAQHWLDLARFAETDGFEHDKVRAEAWRYRDWVIEAMNDDLPYDRFVSLQLAADELAPDDPRAQVATAFCLSGPDMPDINSQEERKHSLLNEITSTVGGVLLALQVECAQCHDHKYDPISQADFYRLRAVFAPAVHLTKNKSLGTLSETGGVLPAAHLMIRGDWRRPGPKLEPAFPRIANSWGQPLQPVRGLRSSGRRAALARWLMRKDHPLTARVIVNRLWQYHFGHGLSRTPSDFGLLGDEPLHAPLLDWLARELVSRQWSLKKIHRLIVTSSTYRQASRPNADRWNVEPRSQAERSWQRTLKLDAKNLYLSRYPRRRLSGEAIRDAMLVSAGTLNTQFGGPGVRPPLPRELLQTLLKDQWLVSPVQADHHRRSIYVFARRNLRYPIFEAFDRPDANASCPRRDQSTTAPQSLLMLNSEFSLLIARRFAGHVLSSSLESRDRQIAVAFRRALARKPSSAEYAVFSEFLIEQIELLRREARPTTELALPLPCPVDMDPYAAAALTDLCLALFNSNEFLYID